MKEIKKYVKENKAELYKILYDLCHIPAPSHIEHKRSEYCLEWFHRSGMTDAYVDEALNVIFPYQAEESDALTVMVAHTDTVFPDTEPMPYEDDGEYIRCPGVGDDTASVAVLMLCAKYFAQNGIDTKGMLFVCNSCEEGLGNLKGTRRLFTDFEGRIRQFISFDSGSFTKAVDECVGSHRYEVEAITAGGHSWAKFGNKNAIAALADIVCKIYSIDLPKKEGKKVTYNVGEIRGGTSVNTIAQSASMLCEYRSDDLELLTVMREKFDEIFRSAMSDDVQINVTLIGERPCGSEVDAEHMERLRSVIRNTVREVVGDEVTYNSGSTDCNIPQSLGVPAITNGVYIGSGAHTREEWIKKDSLPVGLEIGIKAALGYADI